MHPDREKATNRISDRAREVRFGLGLLLSVSLGFAALEFGYRAMSVRDDTNAVDWPALAEMSAEQGPKIGPVRFRPGAMYGQMRFNSFGLRGPEPEFPPPAGLVRIAFLGDSKILSADLQEEETLPARTIATLATLVPSCRFDYVTIAGPGYEMPTLASLWREIAPAIGPDMVVLLAGTVTKIGGVVAVDDDDTPWFDYIVARSALLRAVRWRIDFLRTKLVPVPPFRLDEVAVSEIFQRQAEPLVAALGSTPTLAMGYRSRLRSDQTPDLQFRYSYNIRGNIPGLTPEGAVVLSEKNVAELSRIAGKAGWRFIDPIAEIPGDSRYFVDDRHFSSLGIAALSEDVAREAALMVRGDCTVSSH